KQIESTNPCVSGDTLIAVADGRNYVSIEDLAREGRGVPVFCWSGDGMVVRMGRNPRKTREQVPIVEVTFDDNSSLKLTKNHRVMLRDGSYVEAGSLKEGDRIMPFFKIQYRQRGKKSKYWHIHQNQNVFHRGEHKIIAEFMLGRKLKRSEVVHHINYDTLDNSWANIQIMTSHEHRKLHRRDMLGSNNPYHRMPEDWIKEHLAVGRSGEDNGMFGRIHSYETRVKISESTRRRFSDKKFSKIFRERMNEVMADQEIREKISIAAKERWKDSNLEGECPVCGTRIEYIKSKPQVCCSRGCSNTYRALNKPAIAELNHRVASVQDCGISDVYNITVDDYHNFATITREYESKKGNKKLSGIIVSNCGEQPLLPYESCVLGSINLSRLVEDGEVNWKRLGEIIPLAVRFLDNIIDLNKYPVEEIAIQTKATRKIGLGIMGWTEMLIQLRIPYDSEKALELAEQVMEFIRNRAERASAELAKVRGNFEHIDLLKQRRKWKRNATLITIAPTGSISLIAGTSSGIEPLFAIVHDRVLTEGVRLTDTNRYFVEIAEERGFWCEAVEQEVASTGSVQDVEGVPDDIKRLFKTAHEIDPEWHVRVQAAFQKHTDNAVSKTVNVPNNASTEDIRRVFLLADELGLKGITVFRDGSLEGLQVLYAGCPTCEDVRFTDSP
ncbi:MAG: HNH endonuclease, partial [Promethearchaeota archaeon]